MCSGPDMKPACAVCSLCSVYDLTWPLNGSHSTRFALYIKTLKGPLQSLMYDHIHWRPHCYPFIFPVVLTCQHVFLSSERFSQQDCGSEKQRLVAPSFQVSEPRCREVSRPTHWRSISSTVACSSDRAVADAMLFTWLTPSQSRREHCLQRPWPSPALSGQGKLISKVSHGVQFHPSKAYQPQRRWPLLVLLRKSLSDAWRVVGSRSLGGWMSFVLRANK